MPTTADLPVRVEQDRTLRVKIIDACGMTCTFCHNEGTPVVADNLKREIGAFMPSGKTGRMSAGARGSLLRPHDLQRRTRQ